MDFQDGVYKIQDVSLLGLAKKYGTPLYVYDSAKIKSQYQKLIHAFKDIHVKIKYACKANTNMSIMSFLHRLGSGLDTVSIQEIYIGLKSGFKAENIIFTPNSVDLNEIKEAMKLGVVINIDSISILEQFGMEFRDTYPICIRINPHIMAGGNYEISTGHIDSKFGISIHQLRHVQRIIEKTDIDVIGLHMHTGSDILNTDVFVQGAQILFDLAIQFKNLRFIDLGSGFKVPYESYDTQTNIEELGKSLSEAFHSFCQEYGKTIELWLEPGKYLVSEAGYFLVNVNLIKQTTATIFVGVDSGFNHLIRPKLYNAYHHITNISYPSGTKRFYTVVGNICETDTFAWDRELNEVNEGDILCFSNAGAYGYAMSSNYNSRLRPIEIMIHNNQDYLVRNRETLEDILKNQVLIEFE